MKNIHFLVTISICSRPIVQVCIDIFCLKLVYSVLDEKHIFGEITKKQCLAIGNLSTWSQEGSKDNGEIKVIMFLCYPHKHHVIPKHKHRCF